MTVLVSDLLWDMLSDSHAEPRGFCVSAGNGLPPAWNGLAPDGFIRRLEVLCQSGTAGLMPRVNGVSSGPADREAVDADCVW